MRVLLAESDTLTARSLELMLRGDGVHTYQASMGEDVVELAKIAAYDVILVSDTLADMSPLAVVREARHAGVKTGMVVLATDADHTHSVALLNAGADDVVSRPVARSELLARLQAVSRRAKGLTGNRLVCGPIEMDDDAKALRAGGRAVHLTGKEYVLLRTLLERRGNVVSKQGLMDAIYGGEVDDEPEIKIVDVFVCKIRSKLRRAGADGHIETVWGQGYRAVAEPVTATGVGTVTSAALVVLRRLAQGPSTAPAMQVALHMENPAQFLVALKDKGHAMIRGRVADATGRPGKVNLWEITPSGLAHMALLDARQARQDQSKAA